MPHVAWLTRITAHINTCHCLAPPALPLCRATVQDPCTRYTRRFSPHPASLSAAPVPTQQSAGWPGAVLVPEVHWQTRHREGLRAVGIFPQQPTMLTTEEERASRAQSRNKRLQEKPLVDPVRAAYRSGWRVKGTKSWSRSSHVNKQRKFSTRENSSQD